MGIIFFKGLTQKLICLRFQKKKKFYFDSIFTHSSKYPNSIIKSMFKRKIWGKVSNRKISLNVCKRNKS